MTGLTLLGSKIVFLMLTLISENCSLVPLQIGIYNKIYIKCAM